VAIPAPSEGAGLAGRLRDVRRRMRRPTERATAFIRSFRRTGAGLTGYGNSPSSDHGVRYSTAAAAWPWRTISKRNFSFPMGSLVVARSAKARPGATHAARHVA